MRPEDWGPDRYWSRVALGTTCCLLAALGFAGAMTPLALTTMLLPAVVVGGVVCGLVVRTLSNLGSVVAAGLLTVGLAQVNDVLSGELNGPVARSTLAAVAAVCIGTAGAARARPLLLALGVALELAAALFFGAAAEVMPVVALSLVAMLLVVPYVEASPQRSSTRAVVVPAALVAVVGLGASGTSAAQTHVLREPPRVFAVAQTDHSLRTDELLPGAGSLSALSGARGRLPASVMLAGGAAWVALLLRTVIVRRRWRIATRRLRSRGVVGAALWADLRGLPREPHPGASGGGLHRDSAALLADQVHRHLYSPRPQITPAQGWRTAEAAVREHQAAHGRLWRARSAVWPPNLKVDQA